VFANSSKNLLRNLLRPAVRFAIRRGIKVRTITEELKGLLLEEAHHELARTHEDVNVSRLSVITGLQRRDIQRLSTPIPDATNKHLDLMTRVIGTWSTNERFSRGSQPRELSLSGSESDFAILVRSVSSDLNPSTILFELERLRLVERDGNCVRLLWSAYQISGDVDDAYALLERDLSCLVMGVDHNITRQTQPPNLHISTRFDNVSTEALARIRDWLLHRGAAFHAEIREFVGSFDKDINPQRYSEPGGARVTVGSFSLCEIPEGTDAE
jgi:hypothetical protein